MIGTRQLLAGLAFIVSVSVPLLGAIAAQDGGEDREQGLPTPHGEPTQKTLTLAAASPASFDGGSILFVGTATVIIRYAGFTILTDPNFLQKGDLAHFGYGITSERLTEPGLALEQLPPIDFVLLSHLHGDHFDQLVQERLDKKTPIVTTPRTATELEKLGFSESRSLHAWETLLVTKGAAKLRIVSMPGRHGPQVVAKALPEVMGSMLEFQDGPNNRTRYRLYISGDTLVFDDIKEIPRRFPEIDLALLHLGGTRVTGVLTTMDAKQGVEMLQIVAPHTAIPIHYEDYAVFKSPLEEFVEAAKAAGLQNGIKYLKRGETYRFRVAEPSR